MTQTIRTNFYLATANNQLKKYPVILDVDASHVDISFGFNDLLKEEIKQTFEGVHWCGFDDPPKKVWRVKNSPGNRFKFAYLQNMNPYAPFETPLLPYTPTRNLYKHQIEMVRQIITRRLCYLACEMGTGKTLSAISAMEYLPLEGAIWYIGPVAAIRATELELIKWDVKLKIHLMTYDKMVSVMREYSGTAPQMVVFDEASKLKTPESQRSQSARHLSDSIRNEWGDNAYIVAMSGTPSPKNPVDWYNPCETICPGFIREGDIHKFRNRLAVMKKEENPSGGYWKLVTWKDNPDKCDICGELKSTHSVSGSHGFKPSRNEVSNIYNRLKGLVLVQLKKDCLDLPEKTYQQIRVQPNVETLRVLQSIKATAKRAIEGLTLARELSDGFQYTISKGTEIVDCPVCNGEGNIQFYSEAETEDEIMQTTGLCPNCGGSGTVYKEIRETIAVPCPKDDYLLSELDEHDEIGRYIVWVGFTATVDKLCDLVIRAGWTVLRVDGRGYHGLDSAGLVDPNELLKAMDNSHRDRETLKVKYPRVCFIGQADAGGMALTLTAAPTMLYYSNSFKGEARMQSEDRAHRIGMDENRGLVIKDLIHLPTDLLVLRNLQSKRDLQHLTMEEFNNA